MAKNQIFSDKLISLREAAKITGYHPDYLSYLIRKKKINGKMIGRMWFTDEKSVRDYFLTQRFLSIKNFLFFIIKLRTIVIFVLILVSVGFLFFWLIDIPFSSQVSRGDFNVDEKELQVQNFSFKNNNSNQITKYKVTSVLKNEEGEIEILIQPNSASKNLKTNINVSWFERLKNFFRIKI